MSFSQGAFLVYDRNIDANNAFMNQFSKDEYTIFKSLPILLEKYGRRNISISTVAPTGTLGFIAKTTSGIEPIFMAEYSRRIKVHEGEEHDSVDLVVPLKLQYW